MSGDAGATNSNVVTGDSAGGTADTSKHIGHDTNEWKTVTIEPDYCNVGGTVPFDSYATLDNGVICSPDVIARGTEVYRQGDLYQGTQANAGAGIHSGVSQEAAQVRFLAGNSGIVVNNLPVIEQGRHALINTTPYGYSGAYSQTVTCEVPISSEQAMRNEVQYLSDYSQQINNELIPGLNRQLNSLQEQYDNTSNWPWEDRELKDSLSGQIKRTKNSITGYQDTLIYNRARTNQLFDILEPNGTFVSSQPSWNEQQAINRAIERQQRAIQNIENWRTGPVLGGMAMLANASGAPIEVVENLRVAGENLGFASMGMGRGSRPTSGRPLYEPPRALYQPIRPLSAGTFVRPIRQYNFASLEKLEQHFIKHGGEFKAENVNEYLNIGNYIIRSGYKVQYDYKGEMRTGYVSYFTNSSKGESKFGFVGTNNQGHITTIHVESGKSFWRMLNGKGPIDKTINVVE